MITIALTGLAAWFGRSYVDHEEKPDTGGDGDMENHHATKYDNTGYDGETHDNSEGIKMQPYGNSDMPLRTSETYTNAVFEENREEMPNRREIIGTGKDITGGSVVLLGYKVFK